MELNKISFSFPIAVGIIAYFFQVSLLSANPLDSKIQSNPSPVMVDNKNLLSFSSDDFENVYQLQLVEGWRKQDENSEQHFVGIKIMLMPGWKTYWRVSGPNGFPMNIEWEETYNLESTEINWPTPTLTTLGQEDWVGYEDTVIFPISLVPNKEGEIIWAKGNLALGICEKVCIPIYKEIELFLDPNQLVPTIVIQEALLDQPLKATLNDTAGGDTCWYEENDNQFEFYVEINPEQYGIKSPFFSVAEDPDHLITFYKPELIHEENNKWKFHSVGKKLVNSGDFDLSNTIFTVVTSTQAIEFTGC